MTSPNLLETYKPILLMDTGERYFPESIDGERGVIYGRIADEHGDRWLTYWFWYRMNWSRFKGRHKGDWEGIQLLLQGDTPILAVYAQHAGGRRHEFAAIQRNWRPIVYAAKGTHASYGQSGWHRRTVVSLERANGKGRCIDPHLEIMPETGWPMRPEHWGEDQGSPSSPGRQWRFKAPTSWARSARIKS